MFGSWSKWSWIGIPCSNISTGRAAVLREMQYGNSIATLLLPWNLGDCRSLQVVCYGTGVGLELNHENDNSVGLGERQVGAWHVLGTTPPWGPSGFSPAKSEIGAAPCMFVQAPPWRPHAFQFGIFATKSDCLVLDITTPWDRGSFSLGKEGMARVHCLFDNWPSWSHSCFSSLVRSTLCSDPLVLKFGEWSSINYNAEVTYFQPQTGGINWWFKRPVKTGIWQAGTLKM